MGQFRFAVLAMCSGCSLLTGLDGLSNPGDAATNDSRGNDGASPIDGGTDASNDGTTVTAPTFVQIASTSDTAAQTSVTLSKTVAVHNTLVLAIAFDSLGTASVGDSHVNTFVDVIGPIDGTGTRAYVFTVLDALGGVEKVTATINGAPPASFIKLFLAEYAGISAIDEGAGTYGTTSGVDGVVSGFMIASSANDLLFGFAIGTAMATGSNLTTRANTYGVVIEDAVVGTGSHEATATMTAGSSWTMLGGLFKSK